MTVIVGLEGVLALHEWRKPMIEEHGWDAYHRASDQDAAVHHMVQLVAALHSKGNTVYCITDRPEKWRMATVNWMTNRGIMVDTLLMRAENDWRKSEEMRTEMVRGIMVVAKQVLLAIDDSEKACDAYRAAGIPTLQLFNPNGAT